MTNNDIFRRLRYTFNLRDQKVVSIFALANRQVSTEQVENWLKKEDDKAMMPMADIELASFLNGFIVEKRGRSDKGVPAPEKELTGNVILQKLKIALTLQNDDIIDMFSKNNLTVGKAELTAFFRKPDHKNYRLCKSQFLRNFLMAVQNIHRPADDKPKKPYKNADKSYDKKSGKSDYSGKPSTNKAPREKTVYVNPKLAKAEQVKVDKPKKSTSKNTLKLKPKG